MIMQERFNVGGAMLVKLIGRPDSEAESFDTRRAGVRDIGISQATYSRIFLVVAHPDGGAGHGPRLRLRRCRRDRR